MSSNSTFVEEGDQNLPNSFVSIQVIRNNERKPYLTCDSWYSKESTRFTPTTQNESNEVFIKTFQSNMLRASIAQQIFNTTQAVFDLDEHKGWLKTTIKEVAEQVVENSQFDRPHIRILTSDQYDRLRSGNSGYTLWYETKSETDCHEPEVLKAASALMSMRGTLQDV
ncbi:uncharacterized protein I206_100174 [Kwoniella pini CBS 10737]|uniref:Uncharacterized protein n=1 Tax=Kwoniella pini CBS 10737 TaxID=1296096 RepID=A0A1B9IE66_9TREE|nr:uncharacterized protein I206_01153 [Kwoniella pini CBS 10737]OCF53846.1 hypothetical protein I206_01153 [Kwoniella pini CBS 10737]